MLSIGFNVTFMFRRKPKTKRNRVEGLVNDYVWIIFG